MTNTQKQRQLQFLGYYKGHIDGIWGYQSTAATKRFQAENGLDDDGVFGALTEKKSIEIIVAIQKTIGAEVDGLAGSETMAKLRTYQKKNGLTADGIAGELTRAKIFGAAIQTTTTPAKNGANSGGDWWKDVKYFKRDEFKCKCGGKYCNGFPVEPDEQLVKLCDKIRAHYGKPFTPNSAIRCKKYNALPRIGGATNSQHLYGTAADIPASALGVSPKTLYAFVETLMPNTGGIGLYSWGVHVDTRKTKARWVG